MSGSAFRSMEAIRFDHAATTSVSLRSIVVGISCMAIVALTTTQVSADVILQYFESKYTTITRRMPDVFMAGYDAIWIPPTGVAEGGQSAGYDVFDRFHVSPFFGTADELQKLILECDKANVSTFVDIVLNHNGFQNLVTHDFVGAGKPDYPGFVITLPSDIDGDFHGAFEGGDLNGRINGGLMDIAHEKNHRFIRHPVKAGDPANIPDEPAVESNRQYYLDTDPHSPASLGDTSGDRHSPSKFNLDHPLAGDPVPENATGYLTRYCKWMVEVVGVDGFRLDAAKHTETFFWNDFYDPAVHGIGPNGSTPFSFGEVVERNNQDLLRAYTRKNNFANRDLLDFPLYFTMREILNAHGIGDMRLLENASVDAIDGRPNDGSRGVMFVSNHDELAPPPANDNLAYAHILSRTGFPVVYFNALEFGKGRHFPTRGRGDALGGEFGEIITRLVDIHHEYARGPHITRLTDNDVYIYERDQALIVGLNDNETFDADRHDVQTSFPGGTVLVELSGNARATNPLTVKPNGKADFIIPKNEDGHGYGLWGPRAPRGSTTMPAFEIDHVASVIDPDATTVPNGVRRITPIDRIIADSVTLTLRLEDDNLDDNAIVRIDDGRVNIIGTPTFGGGEFKGFQKFTSADPGISGSGKYSTSLDISKLKNGLHYIEALAFLKRDPGQPPIFQTFRKVIDVDRP
jgi:alpha amylase-like protein